MDANNVVNNVQYPAKTDRFASQAAKNVTRSHGDYFCIGYFCFLTSQSDASFALHYMNHRWVFSPKYLLYCASEDKSFPSDENAKSVGSGLFEEMSEHHLQ